MNGRGAIPVDGLVLLTYIPLNGLIVLFKGKGKKGKEIPLAARIMAVADVYDALVSDRVYKKAISKDEALQIIYSEAGTHFDPDIIRILKNIETR